MVRRKDERSVQLVTVSMRRGHQCVPLLKDIRAQGSFTLAKDIPTDFYMEELITMVTKGERVYIRRTLARPDLMS